MRASDSPESTHCPRCGLRGSHQCLDASMVVVGGTSPAARMMEAGAATDYRERRHLENQRANRGERRVVRP
jgi:hypothetical protein